LFRFKKTNIAEDHELIASYKKSSDNYYIGELYKKYSHLVFGVCLKYLKDEDESKDAVMQIFEKLLDDLKKYTVGNFKSWIHTTAKNHCLMKLRHDQSVFIRTEEFKKDLPVVMESDYALHLDGKDDREVNLTHLNDGVKQLNEEQKICIELFYLQGRCYQEVAEMTGYTMKQVKSYIQNGKRNLKIFIESRYEQQLK
jgi:RNA polymerase sigma factor (sigma-70 family)